MKATSLLFFGNVSVLQLVAWCERYRFTGFLLSLGIQGPEQKEGPKFLSKLRAYKPGNNLLSHDIVVALPSAAKVLTHVFGMGTGISPCLSSPDGLTVYVVTRRW